MSLKQAVALMELTLTLLINSHLVTVEMINDAGEDYLPTLSDGVVVQGRKELRFALLDHLTCNRTGDNCRESRCQRDK